MYKVDREKQIKEVLNRLEQLVLKAQENKVDFFEKFGEESKEHQIVEAYEEGAFAAYAIVKKVFEGDYE